MSLPVLYTHCLRCYEISSAISQEKDKLVQIQLGRDRHEVRIQAMKEGEAYVNEGNRLYLLDVPCMNCDFSQPSIAIRLKKIRDIREYFEMQLSQEKAHNYRTNAK